MGYRDFKDLARRTASDNFEIKPLPLILQKILSMMGFKVHWLQSLQIFW